MPAAAAQDKHQSAIYTTGGVWSKLVERVKQDSKKTSDNPQAASRPDSFLFVVGERGCGKTTLLNAFLHPATDKSRPVAAPKTRCLGSTLGVFRRQIGKQSQAPGRRQPHPIRSDLP